MLDESLKNFYRKNGYVVVEGVFTREELEGVRRRTEEIVRDPASAPIGVFVGRENDTIKDKTALETAHNPVRNISFVARFDPDFQQAARVKVFRDQMLLKPPGGQDKPPHQDQSYFRVQPTDDLVTAWIALDDATIENGCMQYVPGSHRHGILEVVPDLERPVHHVPKTDNLELEDEVTCPVPAGSVIFHHGLTLHRSAVNQTDTWRRALIFHYAASEAQSENPKLNSEVSLEID